MNACNLYIRWQIRISPALADLRKAVLVRVGLRLVDS